MVEKIIETRAVRELNLEAENIAPDGITLSALLSTRSTVCNRKKRPGAVNIG